MNICKILLTLTLGATALAACEKWDDHNTVNDPALRQDLLAQIQADASLSTFAGLLQKSGYDQVLSSSKTFTVFAPSNEALATLDPGIVNDTAKLRRFVANHIATQSYYTTNSAQRIPLLNGKYADFAGNTIESVSITGADKQAKNGVLQVIGQALPVLGNAWETLENNAAIPAKQKTYMLSLFRNVFDPVNAVQTGVDPSTGEPIYQPGTDSVRTNLFWRNVYDLRDESRKFSLFVLADDAWDAEVAKFKTICISGTEDSTTLQAAWTVVKDLARDTVYRAADLPDTILSKSGVKVPLNKLAIVQTIKTSNGNIYVLSKAEVAIPDKLKPHIIEAEYWRSLSVDKRSNMYIRERYNTFTGKDFRDVVANGHGTAYYNLGYRITDVYSVKYKAYWVAVNDNIITTNFTQRIGIGDPKSELLPYVTVTPNNYEEVYLGEFTLATYQSVLNIYLTAANSTAAASNLLVCDYIRLEPVL